MNNKAHHLASLTKVALIAVLAGSCGSGAESNTAAATNTTQTAPSTTKAPPTTEWAPSTTEFPSGSRPFDELITPETIRRTQSSFDISGSGCANKFLAATLLDELGQLLGASQQDIGTEPGWATTVQIFLPLDDTNEATLTVECRTPGNTESQQVLQIAVVD